MIRRGAAVCLFLSLALPSFAAATWPFEENGGRFAPIVRYVTRTPTSDVFVTNDGKIVHSLRGKDGARWSLVETMDGATRALPGRSANVPIHLFNGTTSRKLRTYDTVRFAPHAGIASELRLRDGGVERLFELAPGASGRDVHVRFDGATKLTRAADGGIRVSTGAGEMKLSAPIAWQNRGTKTTPVRIAYRLERDGYSFELGPHDPKLPVIIDPLLQSTYVGGSGSESVQAMVTTADRVYVSGVTSGGFPGVAGGAQTTSFGVDAFVAAYSIDLTALIQATYFGGNGEEVAWAMAVTNDAVYIAGHTTSTNLPGSATGAVTAYAGGLDDGFVARLSLDLTTLVRSSYIGGGGHDMIRGVAASASGVYVTGITDSAAPSPLPGTAGSAQPTYMGGTDAFVARFSADLTTLQRATHLGGTDGDVIFGDAALTADSVYVTGTTDSHDFPNTAGGAQPSLVVTDLSDAAFVTRLNLDLTTNLQSTYYATEFSHDRGFAITTGFGDVFVLGQSPGDSLPGTAGGALPHDNLIDLFVARFSPTLTSVVNATYFGGFDDETPGTHGLVVTSTGVFVTGGTSSPTLPGTAGAIQETKIQPADTTGDAFVAAFSPDLATLIGATYLGGPINEGANAIGAIGNVIYIAGIEDSEGFPGVAGGADETFGGGQGYDGFIAAMTTDLQLVGPTPNVTISDVSLAEGNAGSTLFEFTVSLDVAPSSDATVTVQSINGSAVASGDFLSVPPTQLTFTPFGALSQTVTVQVSGDFDIELDEQFTMILSSPSGMTIVGDGTGTGTIVNDDAVAPAVAAIPTASQTMLLVLVVLVGLVGAFALRS